jgi:hypothetical protein
MNDEEQSSEEEVDGVGIVMSWALQVQFREHLLEQLENMREGIKHHNREAYRLKGKIRELESFMEALDSEDSMLLRQIGEGPDDPIKAMKRNRWST